MKTLDIKSGLLTCNNNEALLKKLLKKFSIRYDDFDEDILGDYSHSECKQAETFIHNLKGVSGNLGALKLSELCESFLLLLKIDFSQEYTNEDKANLKNKYQAIKQELSLVVIEIEQFM